MMLNLRSVIAARKNFVLASSRSRSSVEPPADLDRLERCAQDRRRDRVREQVRPRPLAEHRDDLGRAAGVAAARAAQGLAERAR